MDDLFAPPGEPWQRLAPQYRTARMIGAAVATLAATAMGTIAVAVWVGGPWFWVVAVGGLGWTLVRVVRAARWARSFGYAERDGDLLVTHGLLRRRLTVIPYGRMQSVKVETGPIDRFWGLSTVTLVTASAQSRASIPGLSEPDAIRLRDRLIEAGQSRATQL